MNIEVKQIDSDFEMPILFKLIFLMVTHLPKKITNT